MSEKLQSLESLGPIGTSRVEKPSDPVQAEYEEGKKFLEKQEYGQAALALHNALVGFQEKNNEAGIANASNQLGHLCCARGEYENALKHYQQALTICEKSNDRMSVLAVLHKQVEAYKALQQYDQGIKSCLAMLEHYHDNRDPQGTVMVLEKMAEMYLLLGQKEQAADAYRTIGSIHSNFRHKTIAAGYLEKAAQLSGES